MLSRHNLIRLRIRRLLGYANVPAIQLAKRLVEITPHGLDKVFYSDDGATSVEVALKMAYQYWRQKERAAAEGLFTSQRSLSWRYHVGAMSVGGIDLFHQTFDGLLFETMRQRPRLMSIGR